MMALTQQRYTFEEWLALPDDGRRYELLKGELVEVPPPTADHAELAGEIFAWLRRAQRGGYGRALIGPVAVLLDPEMRREHAPEPDVLFLRSGREHLITTRAVEGVPDLMIEILSPSNRDTDLPGGTEWDIYERFGVPAYWIVDPETRMVAQSPWQDGRLGQPVLVRRGGVLSSLL